jgi:hypothetical protein
LDYIVHINNGSVATRPIVLRLLPGEETIFNLKVVNHGEPSNISLKASSPVFKAVRLKKPDHYVVMEEIIPILARMPANEKRLDGEILLSGSAGESRVAITLLRDSEDPGDDLEDPGLRGDEELKDDWEEEASEDEDKDGEYEEGEAEETEKEHRRISFSRDRDLHRYKSASRPLPGENAAESRKELCVPLRGANREDIGCSTDESFVDKNVKIDEGPQASMRKSRAENMERQATDEPQDYTEPVEPGDDEIRSRVLLLDNFWGLGSLQVIPAAIFLALVIVLVLTFITESIPEFPGALASSILIVTLIIYGAATLLKA